MNNKCWLKNLYEYKIGNTPIVKAEKYCLTGNLYVKLEKFNLNSNIKDRTAYYIIQDIIENNDVNDLTILESTSGNLGISLAYFAQETGLKFLCLIDPLISKGKFQRLKKMNANTCVVDKQGDLDYRNSRIKIATELNNKENHIWCNQYDNDSNYKAHYETTGPEIWDQMNGDIDYVLCAVGSGGTICGISAFLKQNNPDIQIIGVEPFGSTIFGGEVGDYLSVGAGLVGPSGLVKKYGNCIDNSYKVMDAESVKECKKFRELEDISVGITTGMCLKVASRVALENPDKKIVVVSSDGGENYEEMMKNFD